MMLAKTFLLTVVALFALAAEAQAPDAIKRPSFEVASVRQNKTEGPQRSNVALDTGNVYSAIDPGDTRTPAGGYFVAINQPVWRFIVFAYKLSGTQELALRFNFFEGLRSNAPGWVTGSFNASADRFDIQARAPADSSVDDMRLMMQSLLADRFHLTVHRENHDAPAFGLVLVHPDVPGPNLRVHPASDTCASSSRKPNDPAAPGAASPVGNLPPACGVIAHVVSTEDSRNSFGGRGVPLGLLATSLPTMTGMAIVSRPVVDETGLVGLYDLALHWKASPDPETGDTAAAFREALKAQLGLALKPTRAPIGILVLDQIERPTEN